jgi:hypothetical protein
VKSKHIHWPAASVWITGEIATTLQASTEVMGTEMLRKQCWYVCQLLRENLVRAIPYSFIDKGTVKYHDKRYATLGAELGHTGRPPLVSDKHRELLIKVTLGR